MTRLALANLMATPEGAFALGALTTALTSFVVTRYRWTAAAIGPVTRRLLQHMGWQGVAMSMGISLIPDLLHAPIGAMLGFKKKEGSKTEAPVLRRKRKNLPDVVGLVPVPNPRTVREAMLNAVLKNNIGSYGLSNCPEQGLRAQVELILDKEDTPWLS